MTDVTGSKPCRMGGFVISDGEIRNKESSTIVLI